MEDQDSTVKDTLKKIIGDKKDGGIPINEKGKWLDKKQRFDFTLQGYKFKVYSNNKITNEQFKTLVYGDYNYGIIYNTPNTDIPKTWIFEGKDWFLKLQNVNAMYQRAKREENLLKQEDFEKKFKKIIKEIMGKDLIKMGDKRDDFTYLRSLVENGSTQIILTGAPGNGKTRLAKKIAEEFCQEQTKKYELVQFHPSYDYTDFVEGIRPVEYKDQDGIEKVEFRKVDGIFKKFCRKVANDDSDGKSNEKYFFIIDEINRADLSKVFGELMYCLETDKRGSENRIQTQYANLHTYNPEEGDYYSEDIFEKGFYIPKNVIIIGTMNDIDRSVESMDFALRRRFVWREITVQEDETKLAKTIMEILFPDETWDEESLKSKISLQVAKYILYINKQQIDKQRGLNKHYYISQGQFSNIPGVEKWKEELLLEENSTDECVKKYAEKLIKDVWNLRLESLLYEYVRGEGNEEKFVNECNLEAFKEWEKVQKNAQNNTPSEEKE